MTLTVNGEARTLDAPATVADLLPTETRGLAVAVNGTVVPRARHATTAVTDGDVIEIVTAVQGG